jgi:hypothetical protein
MNVMFIDKLNLGVMCLLGKPPDIHKLTDVECKELVFIQHLSNALGCDPFQNLVPPAYREIAFACDQDSETGYTRIYCSSRPSTMPSRPGSGQRESDTIGGLENKRWECIPPELGAKTKTISWHAGGIRY